MKKSASLAALALLGAGFLLAPQPSTAQVVKQGNAYSLSLDLKKGAVYKYKVLISFTPPAGSPSAGGPASQNMPVSLTVKDVKNGVATVQLNSTRPSMGGGQGQPSSQTIKIDRKGKISDGAEAGVFTSLPTKPVKIGETWKSTMNTRAGMGIPMTVNTTSTLKEVKTAGGKQVAIIAITTNVGGSSGMKGSGKGTITVDVKDGMMLNYDLAQTMTMTMNPPQPKAEPGKPAPKPGKPMVMTIPIKVTMSRA